MQYRKILAIVLMNVMLIASFGLTLIDHHCNMANSTNVSVLQLKLLENNYSMPSSCCSNNQQERNDIFKTELKNKCCELNQEQFELSPSSLFNTFQKTVVQSEFFQKSINDVKNSEAIKQLENYYETTQVVIIKPTTKILKFISKITSLKDNTKEDSQK